MELIIINNDSVSLYAKGTRSITISKKSSVINFTKRASEELDWVKGTRIIFAQDKNNPKNILIASVGDDIKGAFIIKDSGNGTYIKAKAMITYLINIIDDTQDFIKLLIGAEPKEMQGMKFYPLIPVFINQKK